MEGEEEPEEYDSEVFVVPTSHASEDSYDKVYEVSELVNPDLMAVELDEQRLQKLKQTQGEVGDTNIKDVIKNTRGAGIKGRIMLLMFSLLPTQVASKLGNNLLGIDMLAGYEVAQEREIPLALVDRDIGDSVQRFSQEVGVFELLQMVFYFIIGYVQLSRSSTDVEEEMDIEDTDMDMEEVVESLNEVLPSFKKVFIDERNEYMVRKLEPVASQHNRTVLVIGAAHEPGVNKLIRDSEHLVLRDVEELETDTEIEFEKE